MTISQKLALAATLGLAITLTFTACDEKNAGVGTLTDTRDGKEYKTIKIGEQVWMAENLNYEAKDSKCYGEIQTNCTKYGRLYDFETAIKACPSGWHLPSNAEWQTLVNLAGGDSIAGKKLKAKSGWNDDKGKSSNGTDEFGFSALPGGYRNSVDCPDVCDGDYGLGDFGGIGYSSFWYSSETCAFWRMNFDGSIKSDYTYNGSLSDMFSVRCLQDDVKYAQAKRDAELKAQSDAAAAAEAEAEAKAKAAKEATAKARADVVKEGSFTDARDKKIYKAVKIGKQIWMAENLNFEAKGSKCYDGDFANCKKYGRLYNWLTAIGVCPEGWRLPANYEWEELLHYVDGTSETEGLYESKTAGKFLKAMSGWENDGNGTDNHGFSALPSGYGNFRGGFGGIGSLGTWWTSSEHENDSYKLSVEGNSEHVYYAYDKVDMLFSVRCLMEEEN